MSTYKTIFQAIDEWLSVNYLYATMTKMEISNNSPLVQLLLARGCLIPAHVLWIVLVSVYWAQRFSVDGQRQTVYECNYPDNKVHGAIMGLTWVLSAPDGPHVGPMNIAIRVASVGYTRKPEGQPSHWLNHRGRATHICVSALDHNCFR